MRVEACGNILFPGLSARVTNTSKNAERVSQLQRWTMQLLFTVAEMGIKRV